MYIINRLLLSKKLSDDVRKIVERNNQINMIWVNYIIKKDT